MGNSKFYKEIPLFYTKMKRKLIKQGRGGSFTINLPKKWVDQRNLKAGEDININEIEGNLIVSQGVREKKKSITIDITGMYARTISIIIKSVYQRGFTELKVNYDDEKVINYKSTYRRKKYSHILVTELINEITSELIGFEIVDQGNKYITIKQISKVDEKDFEPTLRRIFRLMADLNNYFYNDLKKGELKLEVVNNKISNIHKFINYAVLLTEVDVVKKNAQNYFATLKRLMNFINTYSYLGYLLFASNKNFQKDMSSMFKDEGKLIILVQKCYYNFTYKDYHEFISEHEKYIKKCDSITTNNSQLEIRTKQLVANCISFLNYIMTDAVSNNVASLQLKGSKIKMK